MTSNYFCEVDLLWNLEKTGTLSSAGLEEINVISPTHFVYGKKNKWTPEHILAGALSSSFMNTFLEMAENNSLNIFSYKSNSLVKLQIKSGNVEVNEILIMPIIQILSEKYLYKAIELIELAEKKCPIKKLMKVSIQIHSRFEFLEIEKRIAV